jgi:hypothetical protein
MALKMLRAIRLDPSDTFVFERAAEPGEWLISGAFLFGGQSYDELAPKARVAFRSGFLGLASFGWSTLGIVTEATAVEREGAVAALSQRFMSMGAPDEHAARAAADEEVDFAVTLCDHPAQTLIAVHRSFEQGEIRERFRTLTPRGDRPAHAPRAFEFFEADDAAEDPADDITLADLVKPAS